MKIAVISDIHGNIDNFKTFMNYINDKDIDLIINLGDTIGGDNPEEIIKIICNDRRFISIKGNHEESYLDLCMEYNINVSDEVRNWIKSLEVYKELELEGKKLLIMHSSRSSTKETLPIFTGTSYFDFLEEYDGKWDYVLFGHTHCQGCFEGWKGTRIVNPGSLGISTEDCTSFIVLLMEEKNSIIQYIKLRN